MEMDSPRRSRPTSRSRRASTPDPVAVAARTCPGCIDVAAAAADLTTEGGGGGGGGGGASPTSPASRTAACLLSSSSSSSGRGTRTCYCCRREGFCRRCCRRYLLLDPERVHRQWAQLQAQQREQGAAAAAAAAAARRASSAGGRGGNGNGRRATSLGGASSWLFSSAAATAGGTSAAAMRAHNDDDDDEDEGGHGWGWLQEHNRRAEVQRAEADGRRRAAAARLEAAVARAAARKGASEPGAGAAARKGKGNVGSSNRITASSSGAAPPPPPLPLPELASFAPAADDEAWDSAPNTPRGPALEGDDDYDEDEDYDDEAAANVRSPEPPRHLPHHAAAPYPSFGGRGAANADTAAALPPVSPLPQRVCGACFDRHANVDPSRDHDAYGPPEPPTLSCTRPPVVLLPPQYAGRAALKPLAEALAALHFRAEVVDLPGLGSRWREELTPDGALQAVDAAVRRGLARGHGRVLLAGHGMGGFLAARYAALRPEGLLGVVATGCSYRADTPGARLARAAEGAALALVGGAAAQQRAARRQLLPSSSPGAGVAAGEDQGGEDNDDEDDVRGLERCLLRGAGAERHAMRGCAAVLRECGDMPAQLRACREGRIPVLLSSRGGGGTTAAKRKGGGSGSRSGTAAAGPAMTAAERACLDALGPYGHRFSSSAGAARPADARRTGAAAGARGGGADDAAFPFGARRAAAWAAAVAAFCDERI